eukprot:9473217-Pyramimonas_sp.AAC.1
MGASSKAFPIAVTYDTKLTQARARFQIDAHHSDRGPLGHVNNRTHDSSRDNDAALTGPSDTEMGSHQDRSPPLWPT